MNRATARRWSLCALLALGSTGCGDAPQEIEPALQGPAAPALRDVGPDAAHFRAALGSGRARIVALVSPT